MNFVDIVRSKSNQPIPDKILEHKKEKPQSDKKFFCERCDASFKTGYGLTRHMNSKNPCRKTEIIINNNMETKDELFNGQVEKNLEKFDLSKLWDPNLEGGFTALLSASRRSGKTTLIKYMYGEFIREFDIVVFFSNTLHNKNYSFVKEPKFDKFDQDVINDLFEFQKKTDNTFKILIIMDDCVSEQTKQNDALMQLYITGRNWNISCIISSQVSSLINKKSRSNTDFVFIGKTNTPENRMNLINSFLITCIKPPPEIKTKVAKEFYLDKYIVDNTEDYNFIVLNYQSDGERIFNYKAPKGLKD